MVASALSAVRNTAVEYFVTTKAQRVAVVVSKSLFAARACVVVHIGSVQSGAVRKRVAE